MSLLLVVGIVLLVVVLPLSGVVTMVMFWRNPYLGSMFAALQILVGGSIAFSIGTYETKLRFDFDVGPITFKDSTINLVAGGSAFELLIVIAAALTVYYLAIEKHHEMQKVNIEIEKAKTQSLTETERSQASVEAVRRHGGRTSQKDIENGF